MSEHNWHPSDGENWDGLPPITGDELEHLESERNVFEESEADMANRLFRQNSTMAALTICRLAQKASSERLRLQAAQYVVERILGRVQDNPPSPAEDPIMAFMNELMETHDKDIDNDDIEQKTELEN